jgi:predicted enzyme related to lactoylglutathione lyase
LPEVIPLTRRAFAFTIIMMATRLSRLVLMVRGSEGLTKSVEFYEKAVGLHLLRVTDDWAELSTGNSNAVTLTLQKIDGSEPQLSTGYSPWICFDVADVNATVQACVQAGAHLDGPMQYPAHGKVATLRTPDGHILGLYEPGTGG